MNNNINNFMEAIFEKIANDFGSSGGEFSKEDLMEKYMSNSNSESDTDSDSDNESKKGKKTKKVKKVRDPNHPKSPTSSFIFFSKEVRKIARENGEEAKKSKELGEMWGELKDEGNAEKYFELAKADKVRYEKEMEEYNAKKDSSK